MWLVNKRVEPGQPEVVEDHTMTWVPEHSQAQPPPAPEADPSRLAKKDIQQGIEAVREQVTACFTRFQVPGTAKVEFVIAPEGQVTSARVTGEFAHTPTGRCVEGAVRKAAFRRTSFSTTVNYPFWFPY
jgi:hypothetical protein